MQTGPYYDAYVLPTAAEAGGIASGTEAYYAFDYGNVNFIVLDSYETSRSTTGAMARWLEADLAATTQDWIIAFFHHGPFTKGTHDSDTEIEHIQMRENLLPILEAGGVDAVLSGHSHIYERTAPTTRRPRPRGTSWTCATASRPATGPTSPTARGTSSSPRVMAAQASGATRCTPSCISPSHGSARV
jgi:hypothetical protein